MDPILYDDIELDEEDMNELSGSILVNHQFEEDPIECIEMVEKDNDNDDRDLIQPSTSVANPKTKKEKKTTKKKRGPRNPNTSGCYPNLKYLKLKDELLVGDFYEETKNPITTTSQYYERLRIENEIVCITKETNHTYDEIVKSIENEKDPLNMKPLLIDRLKKVKSIRNKDYVVWLDAVNRIAPLTKQRSDAWFNACRDHKRVKVSNHYASETPEKIIIGASAVQHWTGMNIKKVKSMFQGEEKGMKYGNNISLREHVRGRISPMDLGGLINTTHGQLRESEALKGLIHAERNSKTNTKDHNTKYFEIGSIIVPLLPMDELMKYMETGECAEEPSVLMVISPDAIWERYDDFNEVSEIGTLEIKCPTAWGASKNGIFYFYDRGFYNPYPYYYGMQPQLQSLALQFILKRLYNMSAPMPKKCIKFESFSITKGFMVWNIERNDKLLALGIEVIRWVHQHYIVDENIIPVDDNINPFRDCEVHDAFLNELKDTLDNYSNDTIPYGVDPDWVDPAFMNMFFGHPDNEEVDMRLFMSPEQQELYKNCSKELFPIENKEELLKQSSLTDYF